MMNDNKTVFDDLMEALHEVEEYQKGNLQLRSNKLTASDDEIEVNQLLFRKIIKLPEPIKQEAIKYVDELLQASTG